MPPAEPPPSDSPDAGATSQTPQTRDNALAAAMPEPKAEPKPEPLTDEQIARVAEDVNDAEIAQAKLAQAKSKDADVKKFAAMMIAHHGEAKQRQAKLKLKGEDSGLATTLHADAASTLDVLKTASPEDFDRDYVKAQVDGHQKVLDALNDRLIPSATRAEVKALLEQVKPVVEEHLVRAKNLRSTIDSKKPSASTGAK
jgi:putative membrane protein